MHPLLSCYKQKNPTSMVTSKCFTIYYVGGHSIDLVIDDFESDRDEIVNALELLIRTYAENKVRVGVDILLLRYLWYDADKVR